MEELKPPKTLKFYQLIKLSTKSSFTLNPAGSAPASGYIGTGFYRTLDEAEHNRTLETLKNTEGDTFHVFEISIPNPIYKE